MDELPQYPNEQYKNLDSEDFDAPSDDALDLAKKLIQEDSVIREHTFNMNDNWDVKRNEKGEYSREQFLIYVTRLIASVIERTNGDINFFPRLQNSIAKIKAEKKRQEEYAIALQRDLAKIDRDRHREGLDIPHFDYEE